MVRRVERVGSSSSFGFCFSLGVGVFLGVDLGIGVVKDEGLGLGVAGVDVWDCIWGRVVVGSLEDEEGVFVVVALVVVSGADAWAGAGLRRGDLNGFVSVDEGDDRVVVVFRRRRLGLGVGVWFGFIVCVFLIVLFLGFKKFNAWMR